eukprot:g4762.t1
MVVRGHDKSKLVWATRTWGRLEPESGGIPPIVLDKPDGIWVGRKRKESALHAGVDAVLDVSTVSGKHCRLRLDADTDRCLILDNARNGTFVDDKQIVKGVETVLQDGAGIKLGKATPKQPHYVLLLRPEGLGGSAGGTGRGGGGGGGGG